MVHVSQNTVHNCPAFPLQWNVLFMADSVKMLCALKCEVGV